MMTVEDEELFKRMSTAYHQIVAVLDEHQLEGAASFSLLAKMLCQLSNMPKQEMLNIISAAYELDRFLRPQPKEVH